MPAPHPTPTLEQRRRLDALFELAAQREQDDAAYRAAVVDCVGAGLTPTQIQRYAGVHTKSVRRIVDRHGGTQG